MNTLRQAMQEYLAMRRSLGFKLRRVAPRLLDFASFMERQHASYITGQSLVVDGGNILQENKSTA